MTSTAQGSWTSPTVVIRICAPISSTGHSKRESGGAGDGVQVCLAVKSHARLNAGSVRLCLAVISATEKYGEPEGHETPLELRPAIASGRCNNLHLRLHWHGRLPLHCSPCQRPWAEAHTIPRTDTHGPSHLLNYSISKAPTFLTRPVRFLRISVSLFQLPHHDVLLDR